MVLMLLHSHNITDLQGLLSWQIPELHRQHPKASIGSNGGNKLLLQFLPLPQEL